MAVPLAEWEMMGIGRCVAASVKPGDPMVSPMAVIGMGLAVLLLLALVSAQQVGWWRDAETLFRRAMAVTGENWLAANNLGAALSRQGRHAEAEPHFEAALRLRPDYDEARFNLAAAHNNIAIAYAETGDLPAARHHFLAALRIRPDYLEALQNLEIAAGKRRITKEP